MNEHDLAAVAAQAEVLLLGTSVNGVDYERRLTALAPERAVAVLDFWSNYAPRFSTAGRGLVQPARICVMDERAREEMVEVGFDAERLVVTGQPAFDDLAALRAAHSAGQARAVRAAWGVPDGAWLVTFASQPLAELYAQPGMRARHPGYDQRQVLRMLLDALGALTRSERRDLVLLVRPHPREDAAALAWACGQHDRVRVIVSGEGDSRAAVLASDLVCGMTSVLLVESCYLGCLTVSIQPGLAGPDALPTNAAGWSRLVGDEASLAGALRSWLTDDAERAAQQNRLAAARLDGRATERVAEVVYRLIEQRKAG